MAPENRQQDPIATRAFIGRQLGRASATLLAGWSLLFLAAFIATSIWPQIEGNGEQGYGTLGIIYGAWLGIPYVSALLGIASITMSRDRSGASLCILLLNVLAILVVSVLLGSARV